jgi:hypothetical protein
LSLVCPFTCLEYVKEKPALVKERKVCGVCARITRVLVMTVANCLLIYFGVMSIPINYKEIPLIYLSLIGIFNAIQGCITIGFGFLIYKAVEKRIPTLT